MKNKPKQSSKPKLRFPEFINAGEWKSTDLGSSATLITEKVGDRTCTPMSITSGVGLVSQMEKFGRNIAGQSFSNYIFLQDGDFAYNKSATKEYPQGFLARYHGSEPAAVPNSIFTCFRVFDKGLNTDFLNHLFMGNLHGKWLHRFIAVGARAHGSLTISDKDILSIPIPVPDHDASWKEQQKIVDCLSSVDVLIDAETRKLNAIKAHKKGLMRQMFPSAGEAVPFLRFPKFRNAVKWRKSTLGELVEIRSGNSPSLYQLGKSGMFPFVKVEDLNNCDKYQVNAREYSDDTDGMISRNSIIFPKRGAAISLNKVRLCGQDMLMDTNMMALTSQGALCAEFLFYLISQVRLSSIADDSTIPQINNKHIIPFQVRVPMLEEQKHIADCLSSLDTLITSQNHTVNVLKTFNNGLLQLLFPAMNEVQG